MDRGVWSAKRRIHPRARTRIRKRSFGASASNRVGWGRAQVPTDAPMPRTRHGSSVLNYKAGGFAAINSVKRLSLRNSANSASLYTLLKSLYPNSSAFFRYSRDRSE